MQRTRRAQCHRMSLYRYDAVLSDVKDEFQESETIQIVTGLDSSANAAIFSAIYNESWLTLSLKHSVSI